MDDSRVAVVWKSGPVRGTVETAHGRLAGSGSFELGGTEPPRLELEFAEANVLPGGKAARVTVRTEDHDFTFFLRDVTKENPIFLPDFGAAVTAAGDSRSYDDIARTIERKKLESCLDAIEEEPEETYDRAARRVRKLECQTWLGISRDIRVFEIAPHWPGGYWGWIKPRFHGMDVTLPVEGKEQVLGYDFSLGRGCGVEIAVSRRLDEHCLPILRGRGADGDIEYELIAFVTTEKTPLKEERLRGTHYLVADRYSRGHALTPEQQAEAERREPEELARDEETVLRVRAEATNTGKAPAYAWFRSPTIARGLFPMHSYDADMGFSLFGPDTVYCVSKLNGEPAAEPESAVLLQPGAKATLEFAVPHRPIPPVRAQLLSESKFDTRLRECRAFWRKKLAKAARIELPERRVERMVKAGLLHLDLVHYGREPDAPVTPVVGVYTPIGSESIGIVRFLDSMGRHDLARRGIEYFLAKQREDGFVQNFHGYMLETGGMLAMIGEHVRFTRDLEWARKVAPKALEACRFLLDWYGRNKREELRGRGYGMLDGKVADPEDPTRYFMNSALAHLGLKRTAEWLEAIDPREAAPIRKDTEEFRDYVRTALAECIARSPVVPMGDGTWVQTAPAWAEDTGAQMLLCEGEPCFSHGTFACRDSLIGPLWLVFGEVLEPDEYMTDVLMKSDAALARIHNVPFSQPYYNRHDHAHLARGEVKPFLKRYYNGFAALADRETYTFWEHLYHVSPHKTAEEGWFLMETRWMLYMEDGRNLRALRAVPRAWLADGKRIALKNVASHFGPFSLAVESHAKDGVIAARYSFLPDRAPERLLLRLPHPDGPRAGTADGGAYDPATETVEIRAPREGEVTVRFEKEGTRLFLPA